MAIVADISTFAKKRNMNNEINKLLLGEGYEVKSDSLAGSEYDISIAKGNVFKAEPGIFFAETGRTNCNRLMP
ncbi:MAG: hypothetical protein LBT76_06315 [Tannerella sp.]|nr:hypothetical protein [Tannerella sp.]